MRRHRLLPLALLALLAPLLPASVLPASAMAQAGAPDERREELDGSFNLTNRSGRLIERLYASPIRTRQWGENRLGAEGLAAGGELAIRMPPTGGCRTDLRLVFEGGLTEERRDIDTCLDRDVVIGTPARTGGLRAGADGPAAVAQGNPSFALVNDGSRAIRELYASPTSSNDWGEDRLGRDTVPPGGRMTIRLPEGACAYDLRVVWANGRAEERRGLNLCETDELSFR
ncbi:hypothetical protein [Teichococcus aestuarii]|uniref:hypothetical protein n=1 Tax=Teichococcus aestuarii TaxID=568898 RepID=UPI001FEC043F|nr:hypothetical protein [Pseudoroseomonas aestuarii]